MSKQNEIDTRPGARSWDPYFKQSNVKKLKNLLNKALNKGLAVTELNGKQITVVELERLINEKEVDPYIKHYLSSTQQEDIVPWYKDYVDLSLMYKDNNNVRYVDESRMYLNSSQSKYIFDTNPALKSHTAFIHTHDIIDKNLNSSSLNYQVNVQKYPSNNVFVNESGRIDLFSYNLSYLFIGERNHNAKSNNSISDFVPFIRNFSTVSGKASYYTSADAYKNSFRSHIADVNNKTGLVLDETTYQLSYISSSDVNLKLDTITTAHVGEMWGFGNGVYLVPEYSSNFNAQKTNTEISTAYSQIGVVFVGDSAMQQDISIKPYISGEGWYTIGDKETEEYITKANQYKEILKHEDMLDGVVTVYTHPIACELKIKKKDENSEETMTYAYYSYLSDTIELNVADKNNSTYLLYSYTIDNSSSQEYDFSSKKYTYTYLLDETNKKTVDLCKYVNSYTLSLGGVDILTQTTDSNIVLIKFNNELLSESYTLKTVSQLIDPISGNEKSKQVMNFNIVPCSNPSLTFSDMNLSFGTSSDESTNYMNINLSFTYADSIIEHLWGIGNNSSDYVYMFMHNGDEWTYNRSCTVDSDGALLVYSYLFDGGGVVNSLPEGTYNMFSQNCDLSGVTLSVQYSYNITYDRTKYTKPRVDVISGPIYNVSYIADKAIINIISDDFNIWGDVKAFNTNATYLVKNSYILCDSTDESATIELSYQHKSETGGIGKLNVSTYCASVKDTISYTGIAYELPNTGVSTYWEYEYNDICANDGLNNHVFYYNKINLVSDNENKVKLTCVDVADLIYKTIPNTVFETLYNKLDVPNVNTGFCMNDDTLPYPYDVVHTNEFETKYLLRPIFESNDTDNVVLNTIRNVISVDEKDYPLQSEYYIVTIESEYYLYCIFSSPVDGVQVLPPLLYHINIFNENTNLCCKDYEYYTENRNSIKVDLTRPVSYKTSYMLYGFSNEIVRNIKTNTEYTESFYKDKPKDFEITVDGMNYCHCYFPYKFDDENKLKEFTIETTNQAYTYVTKYTGFIQSNTDVNINDGTFSYNVSIETAQKIKKLDVTAYITANFNNNLIEGSTYEVQPKFIFSKNRNGILADKGSCIFIPDISTNYDDIVYPSSTEPIIDEFKSV